MDPELPSPATPDTPGEPVELTRLLSDFANGQAPSADATLVPWIYRELRAIAEGVLGGQRPGLTLQPTALVHEAWLRLANAGDVDLAGRQHFFALAAKAMRQLLVDHARARGRLKRGGGSARETLDERIAAAAGLEPDLLDLDAALDELAALDPRQAQVVELKYFGGLEMDAVAEALAISKSTAEREWRAARAWLALRLSEGEA